jgi:hypothetical protein
MAQIPTSPNRPRLAAVVTAMKKNYHGERQMDRWLDGYGWNGAFHHPAVDVVSLYVDQKGPGDVWQDRLDRHPQLKLYPTVAETITCGTSKLAVDGVIVVGEQGVYPLTTTGIMKHPHYEFFAQIIQVFRDSGRSVPYFNDKELSYRWDWSKLMVDTSHELGFPLQGGSSLPVSWRIPSVEFPLGATVTEALSIYYGPVASYDFHAIETLQCMVERRKGGETGVEWIQAYRGESFWQAYSNGVWSHDLMKSALCRSSTLSTANQSFTNTFPTLDEMKARVPDPLAYHYQHRDGLRSTILLLGGLVYDGTFAAQIAGQSKPLSTQMYTSTQDGRTSVHNCFSPLVYQAELMFLTRKAQYPIERTLLTSGLLIRGVESAYNNGKRIETPELAAVNYQPNPESTFMRS